MSTYFITGATGVLGSAIVRELLAHSSHRLILLIRANDDAVLQTRVDQLLAFLDVDPRSIRGRIEPLRGDTEVTKFGLHSDQYAMLCESVTHIIHSAAIVRMNLPLEAARRGAVGAAENVLQLADLCGANAIFQKVEVVSTVGIGGRWRGPLPERWINESRGYHNTYEEAKAEAEVVIERRTAEGLPVTVHRPSMIVGNSQNGAIAHFQIFYHLAEFISGRRTFGLIPELAHHHVDLVPADYVARAIIWSSCQPHLVGKVLHLCSGPDQAVSLERLRKIVLEKFSSHGVSVPEGRSIPAAWLNALVRVMAPLAPRKLKRALATLPIFLDYLSEDQAFANIQTRQLLEQGGNTLPSPDAFLDPVLDYYLDRTYGRRRAA